uniref:Uncharacterized protein n=1 Tax=Poecilia mexicana TaxID=48701 RepID=A0A3B3YJ26_9TELE
MASLSDSFLITAPLSVCLDAVETVFVQLFGSSTEETVYVFLKTSMARDHRELSKDSLRLNSQNNYQGVAKLLPLPENKNLNHVILHVQSNGINRHLSIPVSRSNGFLFIQTDKPLYTPHQKVKVRAFSMNQELRPANRSVFLTFKDPDHITVDVVEIVDVNNGIPSMQNPFRIPIKPKLGIWTIEASYTDDFTTKAKTDFEVKEYVLPSFSIQMNPQTNFISHSQFTASKTSLTVAAETPKRHLPTWGSFVSFSQLSPTGELDVTVNMQKVLHKHDGPRDLDSLVGSYLYVAVLLQEDTGGITQEAEFATVKFVRSPYRLSLISTPPFIKPGLPYKIQVCIMESHLKNVSRKRTSIEAFQLFQNQRQHLVGPSDSPVAHTLFSSTGPLSLQVMVKDHLDEPVSLVQVRLVERCGLSLPEPAVPLHRHAHVRPHPPGQPLRQHPGVHRRSLLPEHQDSQLLGEEAVAHVASPVAIVLSKGKVVFFKSQNFASSVDGKQNLNFLVTTSMVPSIRLLVYYILDGEGTTELVADSVWMDVKDKCVNGLQVLQSGCLSGSSLDIRTNQGSMVALSAVDSALSGAVGRRSDRMYGGPQVLRHFEHSDLGCGGGGGKDNADVFRLAGLTFMTNANAAPSSSSDPCTAAVRPKRELTDAQKEAKGTIHHHYVQLGADFDQAPSLVRSYFPESWLWEVHFGVCLFRSGQLSISRALPDSLTTWVVKAVGMSPEGMCVSDPVKVSVNQPLSVDVPLPYQVVRGEQLELQGSVYNQQDDIITYCVTLTAGPAFCLLKSRPTPRQEGHHTTACTWSRLAAGGVGKVTFTLLGLEPGEHTLTFTLTIQSGVKDVVKKTLRVVVWSSLNLSMVLFCTPFVRWLFLTAGELPGEVVSVILDPEGLKRLLSLPPGSAAAEVDRLLPLIQVYQYLETNSIWDVLGENVEKNSGELRQKIRDGQVGLTSFRNGDSSYSMWMNSEPSTLAVCLQLLSLPVEGGVSAAPLSACRGRYCLSNLVCLFKGRIHYANPVVSWLTQDQHYGEGFYSIKDMVLTLEALTEYSKVVPKAVLNQDIRIRNSRQEELSQVQLSRSHPVAPPLQVRPSPPGGNRVLPDFTLTLVLVLVLVPVLEAASPGSNLDLVKKVTCSSVELQNNQQYLVLGSGGSEVTQGSHLWCFWTSRYRLPLDSEALVELWPAACSSSECQDYNSQLMSYAVDLQLFGCP